VAFQVLLVYQIIAVIVNRKQSILYFIFYIFR